MPFQGIWSPTGLFARQACRGEQTRGNDTRPQCAHRLLYAAKKPVSIIVVRIHRAVQNLPELRIIYDKVDVRTAGSRLKDRPLPAPLQLCGDEQSLGSLIIVASCCGS